MVRMSVLGESVSALHRAWRERNTASVKDPERSWIGVSVVIRTTEDSGSATARPWENAGPQEKTIAALNRPMRSTLGSGADSGAELGLAGTTIVHQRYRRDDLGGDAEDRHAVYRIYRALIHHA